MGYGLLTAIIEGVDWVQICMCSICYCRRSLPVKILVTKRPFDSTLESATATFGRQFKQPIAGKPGTVVLANKICVTCVVILALVKLDFKQCDSPCHFQLEPHA